MEKKKKGGGNKRLTAPNERQKRFCQEYIKDLNAASAYLRAGYKSNNPDVCGAKLLTKVGIKSYINELLKERSKRTAIDADYVLYGIQDVVERCKQGKPVLDEDGNPTGEWRFEPNACLTGFKMLGQHLKLFTEKHELTGPGGGPITLETLDVNKLSDEALKEILAAKLKNNV